MPTDPPLPTDPAHCPSCGAPLPAQAPQGLCPKCLFAGLAGATDDGADAASPAPVPLPAELAPHFPQFEILDCLGRGGMGVVYRARQKSLDRIVALKLLAPERVGDPAFAERFAREAQALAKLNHPHIVTIHDFGEAGGFFYLLMEYVDGVNLRQAMQAGRFTPEQALAIVPPICEALQYAHEHGIVHRDIKPENLLLDRAGRVMIADFGIAKMLGAETSLGLAQSQPAGTPQYMAPEQQDRRPADHRADIYSLGVVFYEMLTGELPAKQLEVPSRKVQLDVRIDEIVLRALERTPELRYQTAGEFRTQVETLVGTLPEPGKAAPQRTPAPAEVSAWATWLPYLGLLVLLAGLFWTYLWRHDPVEGRTMRPTGVIVAVVGLFLLLKGLLQAVGARRLDSAPPKATGLPHGKGHIQHQPARFSRLAIIGAAWVPLFLLAFVLYVFLHTAHPVPPGEPVPSGPGPGVWLIMALMFIGFAAPLGTTILGWVAFVQIRRSAGRLRGKGLALFDGLLFPVLLVLALLVSPVIYHFFLRSKAISQHAVAHRTEQREAGARSWIRSLRTGQCVVVWRGNDAQFVLYSPESFGHSVGGGMGPVDSTLSEQVNISLQHSKRKFFVSRKFSTPDQITINGAIFRLEAGRAFVLGADGRIEQVEFFPTPIEARNGDDLAAQIEKLRREGGVRQTELGDTAENAAQASPPPQEIARQRSGSPGVTFKLLVAQLVSLLFLLGYLYLVYRVGRRYGWWAALLLLLAGGAVLLMLTLDTSRTDRVSQPVVTKVLKAEPKAVLPEGAIRNGGAETDRSPAAP